MIFDGELFYENLGCQFPISESACLRTTKPHRTVVDALVSLMPKLVLCHKLGCLTLRRYGLMVSQPSG